MDVQETAVTTDRVLTVPNLLSLARIVLVGAFCVVALEGNRDGLAVAILVAAGLSDYLDGYLARRWQQISALGQLLDPLADRLTAIAVPLVLGARGIVPWWFVALLLSRDVVLAIASLSLVRRGRLALPVHFLGKAATFNLLIGLPLLLLGTFEGAVGDGATIMGWAFTIWGTALYWWAAGVYLVQIAQFASTSRGTR